MNSDDEKVPYYNFEIDSVNDGSIVVSEPDETLGKVPMDELQPYLDKADKPSEVRMILGVYADGYEEAIYYVKEDDFYTK